MYQDIEHSVMSRTSIRPTRSVTREMVFARTLELAAIAGRKPQQFKQVDYERAKRELTGESDFDRQQAMLNAVVSNQAHRGIAW